MDIDRYMLEHQPTWQRLEELTKTASRGPHRLGPGELDELLRLYQTTSGHLSYVRTYYRDGPLVVRLTALVASASAAIYGRRGKAVDAIAGFFGTSFPAAVWMCRRAIVWSAVLLFVPAIGWALYLLNSPAAMDETGTPFERQVYVEEQFEQYYSASPSPQFATEVTINNIGVSFLAFAFSAAGCVVGALVIVTNGFAVGTVAAWMIDAGDSLRFWGLILPHGLLELTAIVVAGAAGLRLGWVLIAPGDRTRGQAGAEEGRRAVVVILGLMVVFAVAATVEAFVTGSGLPAGFRVGVGALVEAAFIAYVVVLGRNAVERGYTGSLGELAPGREPEPTEPFVATGPVRPELTVAPRP